MKVARNAPCPCGSGRKHKLCCGTTRDAERRLEAERRAREQALELVASLPSLFPMLRPEGAAFEAWADATGERVPSCDDLDDVILTEGAALVGEAERTRLLDAAAAEVRWQEVVAPAGDQETVRTALLLGAVAAAVHDRHAFFDPGRLALLRETPSRPDDPADAIALVLDACSLWSVDDASAADEALAAIDDDLDDDAHESAWNETLAALAARRATDRHRRRLDAMVTRLEGQLPVAEHEAVSRELEAACAAYRRDPEVRERLLAFLLADSLTPLSLLRLGQALAA